MVSPYEEIAATRPRIRRDVLYTRTPTGVHFHNARGGFSVVMPSAYRFASIIVPHLTGENTVATLCDGLGDKQREMVTRLVGTLYARGFARDAVPPEPGAPVPEAAVAQRFAAQIDYVDHYADDAATRFLRFRDSRVAVLGEDGLARWAALSLIRNGCAAVAVPAAADTPANRLDEVRAEAAELAAQGCPVELRTLQPGRQPGEFGWADLDGYDVVLVTGAHAARQSAALADVPAGRMLVPAWGYGGSVVIGPLMTDGTPGCWTCAALRLTANGDPADAADLWASLGPAAPPAATAPATGVSPARGPVAAMIGNLLGYEVFRLTTQALAAETRGHLVIQHLDSLDTVAEPLLPHPACPTCAPVAATAAEPAPRPAAELAALGAAEPTDAVAEPEAEEDAAQAALEEITGRDVLVQPAAGVFRRYDDEVWAQTPLKVSAVELSTGHGARRTVAAFDVHHVAGARLRALQRAAEVYAEHVVPLPDVLTGAALDAARGKWPAVAAERLGIASGLGGADPAAWCTATSLLGGETVLVPAAALRTFGPHNADRLVEPTAAGTGAGRTPREATGRAVLTALAHATLRAALHGRTPVTAVDPAALEAAGDPELTFLVRSAANLGVPLELLDLGAPAAHPAPVMLARADGRWAVAAGLLRRDAALEAIRDLLGAAQFARETPGQDRTGFDHPDTGDPLLADLDPAALTADGVTAPDLAAGTDWPGLAAALRAAGRDVLAAPVVAPDLAAGRLYATRVLLTSAGAADAD
ncbi:TOMM precursor leader peptide-binding protein [Streptomyces sp. V4-01]|uniref:TOMM leader peptide-binding protein n=1 Tax=Actinacidiphila polyblastidii TaxID=3110430 RepID=A0ABU7PBH2_9ACTN|nr:TOMM precursor leader peptide-binding protein [Streptomyces sp. V4-01]